MLSKAEYQRGDDRGGWMVSIFIVIALLQAAGALERTAAFLLPALPATTITDAFKLVWFSLYAWALFGLLAKYNLVSIIAARRLHWVLAGVLAIACLSATWSLDRWLTVQRVVHVLGTTAIGLYIGYHFDTRRILVSVFISLVILAAGGGVVAAVIPEFGRSLYEGELVWNGLQNEKNAFGFAACSCILLCLCQTQALRPAASRPVLALVILLALVALVMSKSVTSLAALLAGVSVLAMFLLATRLHLSPTLSGSLVIACVLLALVGGNLLGLDGFGAWTSLVGRSSDLSGRSDIWMPTWGLILDNPLLGYGYGAVWFPRQELESAQQTLLGLTWTAYSAHNGFLQLASEIGLPAALLAMAFAILSLFEMVGLYRRRPSPYVLFIVAYQVAFLLANTFEAILMVDRNMNWILFIALPLSAVRAYQRMDPVSAPLAPPLPRSAMPGLSHRP